MSFKSAYEIYVPDLKLTSELSDLWNRNNKNSCIYKKNYIFL